VYASSIGVTHAWQLMPLGHPDVRQSMPGHVRWADWQSRNIVGSEPHAEPEHEHPTICTHATPFHANPSCPAHIPTLVASCGEHGPLASGDPGTSVVIASLTSTVIASSFGMSVPTSATASAPASTFSMPPHPIIAMQIRAPLAHRQKFITSALRVPDKLGIAWSIALNHRGARASVGGVPCRRHGVRELAHRPHAGSCASAIAVTRMTRPSGRGSGSP